MTGARGRGENVCENGDLLKIRNDSRSSNCVLAEKTMRRFIEGYKSRARLKWRARRIMYARFVKRELRRVPQTFPFFKT